MSTEAKFSNVASAVAVAAAALEFSSRQISIYIFTILVGGANANESDTNYTKYHFSLELRFTRGNFFVSSNALGCSV